MGILFFVLTLAGTVLILSNLTDKQGEPDELEEKGWPGSLDPPKKIVLSKFQTTCFYALWPLVFMAVFFTDLILQPGFAFYYKIQSRKTTDPHLKALYEMKSIYAKTGGHVLLGFNSPQEWIADRVKKIINGLT